MQAWVQYLWLKPGSPTPQRKLCYARKLTVGDETLIVGSDFFVATPIWMRSRTIGHGRETRRADLRGR